MAYIDNAEEPTREWVRLREFVLTVTWANGSITTYGFNYKTTAAAMRERLLSNSAVSDVTSNFD